MSDSYDVMLAALKKALPHLEDNARFLRDIQASSGKIIDAFDVAEAVKSAINQANYQSFQPTNLTGNEE